MKRLAIPGPSLALLAASALLVSAACGEGAPTQATPTTPPGETPGATPEASPTPTATPTPALSPTPSPPPFEGSRGPVEEEGAPPTALLVDVRTGQHEGFDRIVFEFTDGLPGYRVEYVEPPITADPSGLPVEIDGSAILQVRFRPAAGYDPFTGEVTYEGPSEIVVGLPSMVELERIGDFEGVLTWVLGLTEEVDFRVSEMEGPFRVVIDVAHP